MNAPKLPMPQPLRGQDTEFTRDTMTRRLPDIVQRVLTENDLPETAVTQITTLLNDIPHGEIRPLPDHLAPDLADWQAAITPHLGQTYMEAPWFFSETYIYRRIMAAVDHFRSGIDPFAGQKQQSLTSAAEQTGTLMKQLNQMIAEGWQAANFHQLLLAALWGNQADMSMWAANDTSKPNHAGSAEQLAHLLVDDAAAVTQLLHKPVNQIDFILDNVGIELIGDLCLADYLLSVDQVATVQFHLKLHPTFVSDAAVVDVEATIAYLREGDEPDLQQAGERLTNYLVDGRLRLLSHPFWTSPHPLWQLPADLRQTLAASDLIISKGDANYRRALGDAPWPYSTPIRDIVSYLPTPALFLRTCKSEVLAGMAKNQLEQLKQLGRLEEDWLVNGRWGIIQLV
jgi:uncharacterized protein with ATP-grasp and redox domains